MNVSEWLSAASLIVAIIGNGGLGGWIIASMIRRRSDIDQHFRGLDDCVHRIELAVAQSISGLQTDLRVLQAQLISRSEVESRDATVKQDLRIEIDRVRDDIRGRAKAAAAAA